MAKENVMQQYLNDFVSRKKERIEEELCAHRTNNIPLCKLKNISFLPNYAPDYSDSLLRNVYLLRYGVAYFAEYYRLYEKIFSSILSGHRFYTLFSVGCGAHIDKVAAQFALKKYQLYTQLNYVGFDCVNWADEVEYTAVHPCTIQCTNSLHKRIDADIVAFPKSISELDKNFLDDFADHDFSDKFILAFSLRKGEAVSFEDTLKVEYLLSRFVTHGYHIEYKESVTMDDSSIFKNIEAYPFVEHSDAFELVNELDTYCYLRDTCSEQCATLINKKPMTAPTYFHDDLYLLEKNHAAPSTSNFAIFG